MRARWRFRHSPQHEICKSRVPLLMTKPSGKIGQAALATAVFRQPRQPIIYKLQMPTRKPTFKSHQPPFFFLCPSLLIQDAIKAE